MNDSAFFKLPGATVDVIDGARGGLSTKADAAGWFEFSGMLEDETHLRASKDGYADAFMTVKDWQYAGVGWGTFVLAPLVPPALTAGEYAVTFAADETCAAIPPALRTRT